jgi:serine/threonine protein kinase
MADQLLNQVLHDRYQVQTLLGKQTGRRTYLAIDLQTETTVVVKLLLFGVDFVWEDLKLFEREAAVLRSLDHVAIPEYLDYFDVETEIGKGFALVQTYLEAKSLQDWVKSGRTFSEDDLKEIAQRLLGVLEYLQGRQPPVVHRDIKPSNILLGDRSGNSLGQIYLVDFGAVQAGRHDGTRTIVGTYGYMPPEQFGGQTTPASDLYALGATLIYLATGQKPDRLPQEEMRICFEAEVNLSSALVDWLKTMTAPSLTKRFKSAQQALTALITPSQWVVTPTNGLAQLPQPFGSKIRLTQTSQMLDILIPPQGFHIGLIFIIFFAIVWNGFLVMWYGMSFAMWNAGGWFAAFFALGHLAAGIGITWHILFDLFGQRRLQITQESIALASEMFGYRTWRPLIAPRQYLSKVELTSLSYKRDSDGDRVTVHPQINIWAGTKQFSLGGNGQLTQPELEWLVQEIQNWLKSE